MSKLFGVDIGGILHKNLSPGLLAGTLYAENLTARSSTDPTAGPSHGTPLEYTFKGVLGTYNDKEINGDLVQKEDRKLLIIAKSIKPAIVPTVGMKFTIADSPGMWRIERVQKDPATATYTCQARK